MGGLRVRTGSVLDDCAQLLLDPIHLPPLGGQCLLESAHIIPACLPLGYLPLKQQNVLRNSVELFRKASLRIAKVHTTSPHGVAWNELKDPGCAEVFVWND